MVAVQLKTFKLIVKYISKTHDTIDIKYKKKQYKNTFKINIFD